MSITNEIQQFVEGLQDKHSLFKYLYNLNVQDFDAEKDYVYYSGPYWDVKEIIAIIETVLTGKWVVSGENVNLFENKFSKMFHQQASVMVNSGSSANLVMIAALKRFFNWEVDDEVILSVVGFPTTLAPVIQNNLKPVFVDIAMDDLNFDLDQIEAKMSDRTKAIFISPVLGNSPDMDRLVRISKKYQVLLVLDNCDSLGSKWNGKYLSDYSIASSCSFYPAHHITTGEGGMVSSNNLDIVSMARSFAWWGRDCYCVGSANLQKDGTCGNRFDKWLKGYDGLVDHKYLFTNIGYNLKPLDLQGSIGLNQLDKFGEIHEKRRRNKDIIHQYLEKYISGIMVPSEHKKAETSWFGVPIICESRKMKQKLVRYFESNRIQTRPYFAGNILQHPAYKNLDNATDYPLGSNVLDKTFFIGCSPTYSGKILEYIEDVIKKFK